MDGDGDDIGDDGGRGDCIDGSGPLGKSVVDGVGDGERDGDDGGEGNGEGDGDGDGDGDGGDGDGDALGDAEELEQSAKNKHTLYVPPLSHMLLSLKPRERREAVAGTMKGAVGAALSSRVARPGTGTNKPDASTRAHTPWRLLSLAESVKECGTLLMRVTCCPGDW